MKKKQTYEEAEQVKFVDHLRRHHPDILFKGDMGGIFLSHVSTAAQAQRMGNTKGWPDVLIVEATTAHCGLALEFKKEGFRPQCVAGGQLHGEVINGHIWEQYNVLCKFNENGFWPCFVDSCEKAVRLLMSYFDSQLFVETMPDWKTESGIYGGGMTFSDERKAAWELSQLKAKSKKRRYSINELDAARDFYNV